MAILPKSFMEATVVLGSIQKPSQVSWFATGFIVGRYEGVDEKGQKKYTTYLVTNKHVVEGQTSLQMHQSPFTFVLSLWQTKVQSTNNLTK